MLVTVIAQFTAKTTNSEKTIYFLSLTSYSINKLKSRMLYTCKKFMFSNFTQKKYFFCNLSPPPPLPLPLPPHFSTALLCKFLFLLIFKNNIHVFSCNAFYFYLNEYLRKNIFKYANFSTSPRQNNGL